MEAVQTTEATPTTTEPVAIETPKVDVVPEAKEDPRIAERFALLAKKEKQQREKEAELSRLMEEAKKAQESLSKYEEKKKNAKKNPLAYMEEAGLTYDELTEYLINGKKQPAESQIEELRKEIVETKTQLQREKEAIAQANFESQISGHLKANMEKYEGCNAFNVDGYMVKTIYAAIENHLMQTGKMMDIDEACDLVEKYLEQEETKREEILRKTKKWGTKYSAPKVEAEPVKSATEKTTLTSSAEAPPRIEKDLTESERKRRAAQMLNFGA